MPLTSVNGVLVENSAAVVSAFDHGFVVGDGAFETVLLHRGRAFVLGRHLDRLARSTAGLGLGEFDRHAVEAAVDAVIAGAGFADGRVRITVTAGPGPLGSARFDGPLSVVVAAEAGADQSPLATVTCVPWTRNEHGALVGLKTTSYAENAVALAYAAAQGSDEAVFANSAGNLCEGSGSNVFVVADGVLCTPPLSAGCLGGITRGLVLERFGGEELDVAMANFRPGRLTEAFLTSAIRGVKPIAAIDGAPFADAPGPVTLAAMRARAEWLADGDEP